MTAGEPPEAAPPGDDPATCAVCGAVVQQRPPTWSFQGTARGPQWLCDRCTRANVRSIEGRLDEAWW